MKLIRMNHRDVEVNPDHIASIEVKHHSIEYDCGGSKAYDRVYVKMVNGDSHMLPYWIETLEDAYSYLGIKEEKAE